MSSKITVDSDCSHEIKRCLLCRRKAKTNLLLLLSHCSRVRLCVTPQTAATRLLCPWNFPGKNTEAGFHFLLQEIFPTQGLNPGLQHCRQTLYHLSHQGSLRHVSAGEISHVLGAGRSSQDSEGTHSTGSGQDDSPCSCTRRWSIRLPQTDWTFFMTQHSSGTNAASDPSHL